MKFDYNRIYKTIDKTFPVLIEGQEKEITGYSISENTQVKMPNFMETGNGLNKVEVGEGIFALAFEANAFFNKTKFIFHNNKSMIHPDYTCNDEQDISRISDIFLNTKGQELLKVTKVIDIGKLEFLKIRKLNKFLDEKSGDICLSYIPNSYEFSNGPAIIEPGKLMKVDKDNKENNYYFTFFDKEGTFILNDKGEKIRGGFIHSNYKTKNIHEDVGIMTKVKEQLKFVEKFQSDVKFQSDDIELASIKNSKLSKISNFYSLVLNKGYSDMFKHSFGEDFKKLILIDNFNEKEETENLSLKVISKIVDGELDKSNFKNLDKIKDECKVDLSKIENIKLNKGWQNYFAEEINVLGDKITKSKGNYDKENIVKNLNNYMSLLKINIEMFYVMTSEIRDSNNESFPKVEDINLFSKKLETINNDFLKYFKDSNINLNEVNIITNIFTTINQQNELVGKLKNNKLYNHYYSKDYGIPEFEESSKVKFNNMVTALQGNPLGKLLYYGIKHGEKIGKVVGFFGGLGGKKE